MLHLLGHAIQCDLLFKKPRQFCFNFRIKEVMFEHLVDVSLGDGCSEVLVVAGHNHLHEILIGHPFIVIRVKVANYIVGISFSRLFYTIVSAKSKNQTRS